MNDDRHTLRSDVMSATILAHGAELCSLKTSEHDVELRSPHSNR